MASQAAEQEVQRLYIAYFGRPADPEGLEFYAAGLDAFTTSFDAIATSFANSAEAQQLINGLTTQEFIEALYIQAFARDYDSSADGTFWLDAINYGLTTKELAFVQILKGAQNDDARAVANKVIVAQTFSQSVDADEYAGAADAAIAKAVLDNVSANPTTVTSGNIDARAAADQINGTTSTPAVGEVFIGTSMDDILVPGDGSDVVRGLGGNDIIDLGETTPMEDEVQLGVGDGIDVVIGFDVNLDEIVFLDNGFNGAGSVEFTNTGDFTPGPFGTQLSALDYQGGLTDAASVNVGIELEGNDVIAGRDEVLVFNGANPNIDIGSVVFDAIVSYVLLQNGNNVEIYYDLAWADPIDGFREQVAILEDVDINLLTLDNFEVYTTNSTLM